jgi:hypothetical protein
MGLRGILRDIIGIFLAEEIIRGAITNSFSFNNYVVSGALILLILSIWFILERFGVVSKFGQ